MHVIKDLSSIYIGLTSLKRLLLLLCHTTVKGKVIFSITICNNMTMLHRVCHNKIIFVINIFLLKVNSYHLHIDTVDNPIFVFIFDDGMEGVDKTTNLTILTILNASK